MIKNYEILKNGLIKQINIENQIQTYDKDYVDQRYNKYGEKGPQMAEDGSAGLGHSDYTADNARVVCSCAEGGWA